MPINNKPAAMLKPLAPLGMAKTMRHLRVPSQETSLWRDKLASKGWLAQGYGIHNLATHRGIALNDLAPTRIEEFEIIDLEPIMAGPKHWTERLDSNLFEKYINYWPMSHDQVGDVVIVKIPEEIRNFSNEVGQAILNQHASARIICADNGVKGEFRVRDLETIISRGDDSTKTKVKEHGNEFWVDPGVAYYSPRLANERLGTIDCARKLSSTLGRKISVCDPYAGVGPALVPLSKMQDVIGEIYASDLNREAVNLLAQNLPNQTTQCKDARKLSSELPECCDLLLVNLPHNSIEHLPDLLGLLKTGHEVVIRGWAIIPTDLIEISRDRIIESLSGCEVISISLEASKSYSPQDTYACMEVHLIRS